MSQFAASHLQAIVTWVKMSVFLQTVGCVHMNLTTLGKGAQSICVPHISHVTVWMKHWQDGVCRLYTFNFAIWEQPSALNWLKDLSKGIVNSVNVLFLAWQLNASAWKEMLVYGWYLLVKQEQEENLKGVLNEWWNVLKG